MNQIKLAVRTTTIRFFKTWGELCFPQQQKPGVFSYTINILKTICVVFVIITVSQQQRQQRETNCGEIFFQMPLLISNRSNRQKMFGDALQCFLKFNLSCSLSRAGYDFCWWKNVIMDRPIDLKRREAWLNCYHDVVYHR
jgi:hypothetical protein